MGLRLRHLMLRAITERGPFGVRVALNNALVILRADNSSGKSTCVQSIVYALGLEGMFTPGLSVPLPRAMTDELLHGEDTLPVLESEVMLEIENGQGDVITIRRMIKSESDKRLVSTWNGPVLTTPGDHYKQRDYFLKDPGAATRPDGFHYMLARFLGWELPSVLRYDGSSAPLYLECLFPLMIIEQKKGWSAIQARFPQHYRIRDVSRRAIEFLLKLDGEKTIIEKQRLEAAQTMLRNQWKAALQKCAYLARSVHGSVQGLAEEPIAAWPPEVEPVIVVPKGEDWIALKDHCSHLKETHDQLIAIELPKVEVAAPAISDALDETREELKHYEDEEQRLVDVVEADQASISGLEQRLAALKEDIQRNKDARKLRTLGSVAHFSITKGVCPTCQQEVEDSLLPRVSEQKPMTLDENISFLEEQKKTFDAMLANARNVMKAREQQLLSVRSQVDELRAKIRAMKRTLVSDDRLPSEAAIQERIQLEYQITQVEKVLGDFAECLNSFVPLSAQWLSVQEQKHKLPTDLVSAEDKDKLECFEKLFVDQLVSYGMGSVPPKQLSISRETYRPVYQREYDLDFELSASDMIRMIWAYVLGLLEVSRSKDTNHLGLLILDEPRQQDAAKLSFANLLARASEAQRNGQQIVFATSEDPDTLEGMFAGLSVAPTYIPFVGKILQPME